MLITFFLVAVSLCHAQRIPIRKKSVLQSSQSVKPRTRLSANELFTKYRNGIVTIQAGNNLGTGFFYEQGILTCFHVIDKNRNVTASIGTEPPQAISHVWAFDKQADVAYLNAAQMKGLRLKINVESTIKVGEPLFVIGSPKGLTLTMTEGILSARRLLDGVEYLQLSAAISPGSSGSPVFDGYGDVVGVVVSSIEQGQQLNFAIGIKSALNALHGVALENIFPADGGLSTLNPELRSLLVIPKSSLLKFPNAVLSITPLQDTLPSTVTNAAVEKWVNDEISRNTHTFHLSNKVETEKRNSEIQSVQLLSDYIATSDSITRTVNVNIGYGHDKDTGLSWYSIHVSAIRSGIIVGGSVPVTVWDRGIYGAFGSITPVEAELKNAVESTIKDFILDWMKANQ